MNGQQKCNKTVVLMTTSSAWLGDYPTGVWLEEVAAPYYALKNAGCHVEIASILGSAVPIDKASMAEGFFTPTSQKFMLDPEANHLFSHSIKISNVNVDAVDAIVICGGHGACSDFVGNTALRVMIEDMFDSGKIVAAVCHGTIALTGCRKQDGSWLVQDKVVTGFTDDEETAVQLDALVPFLIESRFIEQGAKFEKSSPWTAKVCRDGNLITAQNPHSSEALAAEVVHACHERSHVTRKSSQEGWNNSRVNMGY